MGLIIIELYGTFEEAVKGKQKLLKEGLGFSDGNRIKFKDEVLHIFKEDNGKYSVSYD